MMSRGGMSLNSPSPSLIDLITHPPCMLLSDEDIVKGEVIKTKTAELKLRR